MKKQFCILIIFSCLMFLSACSSLSFDETSSFIENNVNIQNILITDNTQDSHEVYVINSAKDIDSVVDKFRRVTEHLWCSGAGSHTVDFYGELLVDSAPYPSGLSGTQARCINKYMIEKNRRYIYSFVVPNTVDFEKLQNNLASDQDCIVLLPYRSLQAIKPTITVRYSVPPRSKQDEKLFDQTLAIGEFEPDNYFIPWIELIKGSGNFYDMSECRFSSYSTSGEYTRVLTIFLNHSMEDDEIIDIQEKAEAEYMAENLKSHSGKPFTYDDNPEYEILVITEDEMGQDQIEILCETYDLKSPEEA